MYLRKGKGDKTLFLGDCYFQCADCQVIKPCQGGANWESVGTGYGYDRRGRMVCYECCGVRDRQDMRKTGRACLYLTHDKTGYVSWRVANWPGTLSFVGHGRIGRHNIAGRRYDVWFAGPDGKPWHGVTYGDNTQICHCRRVKA